MNKITNSLKALSNKLLIVIWSLIVFPASLVAQQIDNYKTIKIWETGFGVCYGVSALQYLDDGNVKIFFAHTTLREEKCPENRILTLKR